jgi:hypothetical protein
MSAPTDEALLARTCSECPVSALNVEMCMAQHLLLSALSGPSYTAQRTAEKSPKRKRQFLAACARNTADAATAKISVLQPSLKIGRLLNLSKRRLPAQGGPAGLTLNSTI